MLEIVYRFRIIILLLVVSILLLTKTNYLAAYEGVVCTLPKEMNGFIKERDQISVDEIVVAYSSSMISRKWTSSTSKLLVLISCLIDPKKYVTIPRVACTISSLIKESFQYKKIRGKVKGKSYLILPPPIWIHSLLVFINQVVSLMIRYVISFQNHLLRLMILPLPYI